MLVSLSLQDYFILSPTRLHSLRETAARCIYPATTKTKISGHKTSPDIVERMINEMVSVGILNMFMVMAVLNGDIFVPVVITGTDF